MKNAPMKPLLLLFTVLLALSLSLGAFAASKAASAITTVSTYAQMVAAANGVAIPDAPQGATDVQYSILQSERPIAQIRFTLDGASFHLRAAPCADAASAIDLSGMKALFNPEGLQTVTGNGGEYQIGVKNKNGLIQWFSQAKQCQYSLLTDGAKDADSLKALADVLRAAGESAAASQPQGTSVDGTVSKITKNSISLLDQNGGAYTFSISGRTVNMDGKRIKRKSVVRVNYTGVYAEGCEAVSIMLTPDAATGGGGKGHSSGSSSRATSTPKPSATPKPTVTPKPTNTPKPTPEPKPQTWRQDGIITEMDEDALTIITGFGGDFFTFDIREAELEGDLDADIGDWADVTYVMLPGGQIATHVTFTKAEPEPTDEPEPEDEPDDDIATSDEPDDDEEIMNLRDDEADDDMANAGM